MVTSIKAASRVNNNIHEGKNISDIVTILTKPLITETCTQVYFSYGDELCLDFGTLSPEEHPKLQGLLKGSWQFGARATPWLLKKAEQLLLNSEEPKTDIEIKNAKNFTRKSLENKKILKFEINSDSLELQMSFEEDYALILQPDLEDLDLVYWDLFMPNEKVLEVGAGYFWSCKSIHDR